MSSTIYFSRDLETMRRDILTAKYPQVESDLLGLQLKQVEDWEERHVWQFRDKFGRAEVMTGNDTSAPEVSESGNELSAPIDSFKMAYSLTSREQQALNKGGGIKLDMDRAAAAERAISEAKSALVTWGNAPPAALGGIYRGLKSGHEGLYNHTQAVTVVQPTSGTWVTKSASAILSDMLALCHAVANTTQSIEQPNVLVIPGPQYRAALDKRLADSGRTPIEEFARLNSIQGSRLPVRIVVSEVLAAAGSAASGRMVCFDSASVKHLVNNPLMVEPPQMQGYVTRFHMSGRFGGIRAEYPKSIARMDGL